MRPTAEADLNRAPARRIGGQRVGMALAGLVLVGYVLLSPMLGLAWPYPQRLPVRYHFAGNWYEKHGPCDSHVPGRLVTVGLMWTALGPIARPTISAPESAAHAATPPTLLVRSSGGCYQSYVGEYLPGP
jgi:hypothetical protein